MISLFTRHVNVYEVHNNGSPYDAGFMLGVAVPFGSWGGGAHASRLAPGGSPRDRQDGETNPIRPTVITLSMSMHSASDSFHGRRATGVVRVDGMVVSF